MSWPDLGDVEAFIASITPRQHVREGVHDSCEALAEFLSGKDRDDLANDMLRCAVEMKFIHVGAALEELERKAPDLAARFVDRQLLVRLYHDLAERYDENHNDTVWQYWKTLIPKTHSTAQQVLADMPDEEAGE